MGTILRFASVPLRKMGTDLLASRGSKGKNGNSLACLRNAGSHSAESYCMYVYGAQRRVVGQRRPQLEQTLNRKSRADHLRYPCICGCRSLFSQLRVLHAVRRRPKAYLCQWGQKHHATHASSTSTRQCMFITRGIGKKLCAGGRVISSRD